MFFASTPTATMNFPPRVGSSCTATTDGSFAMLPRSRTYVDCAGCTKIDGEVVGKITSEAFEHELCLSGAKKLR